MLPGLEVGEDKGAPIQTMMAISHERYKDVLPFYDLTEQRIKPAMARIEAEFKAKHEAEQASGYKKKKLVPFEKREKHTFAGISDRLVEPQGLQERHTPQTVAYWTLALMARSQPQLYSVSALRQGRTAGQAEPSGCG